MPVSQKQIAQVVGIDPSLVSHALRGDTRVAESTRLRVVEVARELGYHSGSNQGARELIARRYGKRLETRIISLLFDYIELEDEWGLPTYRGMREKAREYGYDLLTLLRASEEWMIDQEELSFLDRRSDGFVFLVPRNRYGVLETLVQHQIPAVVCFSSDVPPGVATINADNAGVTRQAVEYLSARGHRRIVHLAGSSERSDFRARRSGFETATHKTGLESSSFCVEAAPEIRSWRESASQTVELIQRFQATAVITATDAAAVEVRQQAQVAGLRVPGQLSIIGIDDTPEAAANGLTTFGASCIEIGRCAVEAFARLTGGADYRECSRVVPFEMVERNSVATLPS